LRANVYIYSPNKPTKTRILYLINVRVKDANFNKEAYRTTSLTGE